MVALAPPLRGNPPVTSPYGWRTRAGIRELHDGVDWGVVLGTPVYAAAAGRARRVSNAGGGWGVEIDHGDGTVTKYWHLNSRAIGSREAWVTAGQLIAWSGASGLVTGPHLHFSVFVNGQHVDPLRALQGGIGNPTPTGVDPSAGHVTTYPAGGCGPGYVPAKVNVPVFDGPFGAQAVPGAAATVGIQIERIGRRGEAGDWNVCLLAARGYRVGQNPWGADTIAGGAAHEIGEGFAQGLSESVPLLLNIGVVVMAGMVGWQGVKNVLGVK